MRARQKGGSDVKPNGPSLESRGAKDVRLSAAQLAAMANVLPQDIQYWGRSGYLNGEGNGQNDEEAPEEDGKLYVLSQVPKAQLMALFTKRLEIKASKASELADQLLAEYQDRDDAFSATIGMVQLLESRITAFVNLILELNLMPRIAELLKEKT